MIPIATVESSLPVGGTWAHPFYESDTLQRLLLEVVVLIPCLFLSASQMFLTNTPRATWQFPKAAVLISEQGDTLYVMCDHNIMIENRHMASL